MSIRDDNDSHLEVSEEGEVAEMTLVEHLVSKIWKSWDRTFYIFSGISFCGIALSHLNEELQLHVFVLGCFPYDHDNQTANQIRQFVDCKLMEFNLSLDNNKFVVSDDANKMKSAFKDSCIRIGCSIHYVNKQLEYCFTIDIVDKAPVKCDIVQQMFFHVRKIVSHIRRTHKQTELSRKLQSYSDT
ncbi:unnamed protein product [Rotaria socialis]